MALNIEIEVSGTGFECGYWHVASYAVHPREPNRDAEGNLLSSIGVVDVAMAGFASAEARKAGKNPFVMPPVRLTAAALGKTNVFDLNAAEVYAALTRLPQWATATVC